MSVPQNIQELANKVRNEIYGKDVRESIAKSMEATGEVAEWSRQVAQDIVDGKFDEGELATEIERKLNELEAQYAPELNQVKTDLAQRSVYITSFKHLVPNVNTLSDLNEGDWTTALETAILTRKPLIFTDGVYNTTKGLILGDTNVLIARGGNLWNPNSDRNVEINYIGEESPNEALLRLSKSPLGVEPTSALSNVKIIGGFLLNGNDKIGVGFYSAYLTNESYIEGITAINMLDKGIQIQKSWYATFTQMTAKSNMGQGISIGENFWGGINACDISYLRAHGNGRNGQFTEENSHESCGVFISLGYGNVIKSIISERNYGAGLVYRHGVGSSNKLLGVYLEGNGVEAREDGKTDYNWGIIVEGFAGGGKASTIETMYLSMGVDTEQSVWLKGAKPTSSLTLREVSGGGSGVFVAEWENYYLYNTPFGTKIRGHFPRRITDTLNSIYTTLHVRNDGDDDNDGRTSDTAYKTIEKAIGTLNRVYTIDTINISGLTVQTATIDLKGVNREVNIVGNAQTKVGTDHVSSQLHILNASQHVNILDIGKVTRLRLENVNTVTAKNTPIGSEDNSNQASVEGLNGKLSLINSPVDGSLANPTIKRGLRLDNFNVSIANSPITNIGATNMLTLSNGSTLHADVFTAGFHNTVFSDGTGLVTAGNRMMFAGGYIYNGDAQ